jgi:glycosyltransferase involved in cell wall biosynthesis
MKSLAIVTTHPVQYNAPLFQLLSKRNKVKLKVFYTWSQSAGGDIFDPGFGIRKQWDIPLLDGYEYTFVSNIAKQPGSHHYKGVINPTLIDELETFNPDAILVYGWSFVSHLKVLRYFKNRIPVYFRGDSTLLDEPPGFSLKKTARRIFLRWVYSHISFAFYTGEKNKQYFFKHGVKEDQLVFMPHAIDNARFFGTTKEDKNYRTLLNIPPGAVCILFAGKLEPKKDPQFLLECFIEANVPGAVLVIVGSGDLEKNLKSSAAGCPNVYFMPFQNQQQMPAVYHMADLFVLPSRGPGETWGLAVNEAMACSKAILVSDKCGCSADLVKPGVNGEVFRAGDKERFIKKLQSLVQDKEQLAAMGAESKKIIADWSFEKCAVIIENEFN